MAENKQGNQQNLNDIKSNTYTKGLIKDYNDSYVPEGVWINAINAVTNSHKGDTGTIGNEPSNLFCTQVPYDIINITRKNPDEWVVFSTNGSLSEIGLFTESTCSYKKVINDNCLNFDPRYLITAYIQYNFDCTWSVFWADGLNPDRTINLDKPPYQITGYSGTADCPIPIYNDCLDCDAIRLNYLTNPPCYNVKKATGAGSLLNGSYQAVLAYSINGERVTDYFTPSNIQSIWNHLGVAGGLEIIITSIDTRFEEYELVLVSTVNSQTVARKIGNYSTSQTTVYIDNYSESNISIDLALIPLVTPIYEKSDKMFALNGYLLRSGVYSKYQFNYQPLANQIVTYWQEVEYPADYYYKGGSNTSYMRDEQYPFFIRWIYNDGDKSASYHIPGRAAFPSDLVTVANADVLFSENKYWQVYNTATVTNQNINITLPDGGIVKREGLMGYWESTEKYPTNRPEVWEDLCGLPIRHHKMPDNSTTHIHNNGGDKIYILGVRFDNIKPPVDNQGNLITNIIGFEILRGSREGNRTIVAKGLIKNMREYTTSAGQKMLYQNYPYNDLRPDYFLIKSPATNGEPTNNSGGPLTSYKLDYYSFHSPETTFNKPFLSYNEVKLYTRQYGDSTGTFEYPYGHPKEKLITNASYLIGLTLGLGIALKAAFGNNQIDKVYDPTSQTAAAAAVAATAGASAVNPAAAATLATNALVPPLAFASGNTGFLITGQPSGAGAGNYTYAQFPKLTETGGSLSTLDFRYAIPGSNQKAASFTLDLLKYGLFISTITYWAGLGTNEAVGIIYELIPYRQYALQFNSHGFYNKYKPVSYLTDAGNTRREHNKSAYIKDNIQAFDVNYAINNLYRGMYVAVSTKGILPPVSGSDASIEDVSRKRVRDASLDWANPTGVNVTSRISAYYSGLKIDYQNQYGQLEGIVEIPVQNCYTYISTELLNKTYSSPTLFGGDIYINRYTEKNPFFFFTQWMFDLPKGTEFDYSQYSNVLYPRYWANFDKFDVSSIKSPLNFNNIISGSGLSWTKAASAYHHLDRKDNSISIGGTFEVINAWFYLFNNGVPDFFVESEVNLAYRDYGDITSQRHYDHTDYTNINEMLRTDIIKAGNYYKYDYSLSVSKLQSNYVSFGATLPRTYDPNIAESCYTYDEMKVIYSLPQNSEQKRDSWRIYLPNNYKIFENIITQVKPINRTGALILFKDAEPTSVTGVDQLQTAAGTKITIGDGGLFAQPFQSLVNSDDEFEYASCQDTRSVVNTPYGVFWMSRDTGKIFNYAGGQIVDIAMNGMRYWFTQNLPNVLTTQFPNFTATENTLVGIGCQVVYDTQYEIVYFCKKDFKSKGYVQYDEANNQFYYLNQQGKHIVELGNPDFFEDCSWTISYDPKTKMWLSFHDWHPDYVLGTNDHFYTIKNGGFWKHNVLCNSYCNYYGTDYAFEVEFPVNTGSTVTTLKSIEYTLEVLNYSTDCIDPYHVLNANFDYAMIYNTEQNSGMLNLNLKPYNPVELLNYPNVLSNSIDIIFAKEENKYRFNQFWDATRDRGEFSGNQYRMFNTEQNGYKKYLNPNYINYSKSPLERKKFRHYGNRIILGKHVSNNLKFNLKVVNTKETLSPR